MTRMPFLYVEAPERKTGRLKGLLLLLLTAAVLTFCALIVFR
jgi:hypothetical protein